VKKTGVPVADPPDPAAVKAAVAVLDNHIAALNARDEAALVATLHFPHYHLTLDCFQAQRPLGRASKIQLRGVIVMRQSAFKSSPLIEEKNNNNIK